MHQKPTPYVHLQQHQNFECQHGTVNLFPRTSSQQWLISTPVPQLKDNTTTFLISSAREMSFPYTLSYGVFSIPSFSQVNQFCS